MEKENLKAAVLEIRQVMEKHHVLGVVIALSDDLTTAARVTHMASSRTLFTRDGHVDSIDPNVLEVLKRGILTPQTLHRTITTLVAVDHLNEEAIALLDSLIELRAHLSDIRRRVEAL